MSTLKHVHRSFLLFFFQSAVVVVAASVYDSCTFRCTTMVISPPFRTSYQPATCGLPGFDLICDNILNTNPLLSFPASGHTFSVDYIWYSLNQITLTDPQGCLQEKLLGFNSSGTPFHFYRPTNFPIYNCSRPDMMPTYYRNTQIACLSGSTYSVIWDQDGLHSTSDYGCVYIGDAMVPLGWATYTLSQFSTAQSVDLSWELPPDCQRCSYWQPCQRDPNDLTKFKCSESISSPPPPPSPGSYNSSQTSSDVTQMRHFLLGIGISVLLLGLLCFCCYKCKDQIRNNSNLAAGHRPSPRGTVATSTTNIQSSVLSPGLEQDTLDTYPTIVVGQSGRILVSMEDQTCSICLSEYALGDTLKTLPECLHKFHADCIDEWLRAKALCPICRTPPPQRLS